METNKNDPLIRAFLLTIIDTCNSQVFSSFVEFAEVFDPIYYCAVEENTDSGVRHMHIYVLRKTPIRLSVVKSCLPEWIHVNAVNGKPQYCIDYLRGSHIKRSNVRKTFREYGKLPKNMADKSNRNHN